LGYRCDELPAFYSRKSGLTVDETIESAREVALIARSRDELNLQNAILLAVPVPEKFEIESNELEKILADALGLAKKLKISGKEITPFLLSQMAERSAGKTLAANIALLENNAAIAAQVAVEITKITAGN
jgi:pseudouridine-5'-phosphate glycosidase